MNVKSIKILNFRNYVNEEINLNEKINIIYYTLKKDMEKIFKKAKLFI